MNNTVRKERNMIRLGDIIIDPLYQVRMKIDSHSATEYAQLLRVRGYNPFPEIVVEEGTNKLVCGFTRMEAYLKTFSPDDEVPGIFMRFKNSAERLFYAAKDNSSHGTPLNKWDKKNITLRLTQEGISAKKISNMLGWPMDKVEEFAGIVIVRKNAKRQSPLGSVVEKKRINDIKLKNEKSKMHFVIVDDKPQITKRGLEHMDNTVVAPKVYENIKNHYNGWSDCFMAKQLIMRIDNKIINLKDERTIEVLSELCRKLKAIGIEC